MDKVRQAVIELEGKWPKKGTADGLFRYEHGVCGGRLEALNLSGKGSYLSVRLVCSRDHFNAEIAQMIQKGWVFGQGKPYKREISMDVELKNTGFGQPNPAPEWVEGELPPKGTVVDLSYMGTPQGKAEMLEIREGLALWWNIDRAEYQHGGVERYEATPLKSARDKAIEALCEIANRPEVSSWNVDLDSSAAQRALIEAIADAVLRPPEDRESSDDL